MLGLRFTPVDLAWCLRMFPGFNQHDLVLTSEKDDNYNCIAWAGDVTTDWWGPGYSPTGLVASWPRDLPQTLSIGTFEERFQRLGYRRTRSSCLLRGFTKVAIYVDERTGEVTHMARQLASGRWTSKLGRSFDVEHGKADVFRNSDYGRPGLYMKKPLSTLPPSLQWILKRLP